MKYKLILLKYTNKKELIKDFGYHGAFGILLLWILGVVRIEYIEKRGYRPEQFTRRTKQQIDFKNIYFDKGSKRTSTRFYERI